MKLKFFLLIFLGFNVSTFALFNNFSLNNFSWPKIKTSFAQTKKKNIVIFGILSWISLKSYQYANLLKDSDFIQPEPLAHGLEDHYLKPDPDRLKLEHFKSNIFVSGMAAIASLKFLLDIFYDKNLDSQEKSYWN